MEPTAIKDVYTSFERLIDAMKVKHTAIKSPADSQGFFTIVATHYSVKGWKTLRAIYLLCSEGFAEDAAILTRSLYEMAVTFKYIAQEPDEIHNRAKLYYEYDIIQLKRLADQIKNNQKINDAWNPPKEILDKIKEEYPRVEGNYKYKDKKTNKDKWKNGWSGLSIFEMAEKTGLDGYHYDVIYRLGCNLSHTNPRSTLTYFTAVENGIIVTDGPSTKEDVETFFLHACTYYIMIAGTMNNILQLGCEKECIDADKTLSILGQPNLKSAQ